MKKILVYASGTRTAGGSGFEKLVENSLTGILKAKIVGVMSNHESGGVSKIARKYGIERCYFPGPYDAAEYQSHVNIFEPDLVVLSGWIKYARGLDPKKTINIHPGPLPYFGGQGMHGHHVHEKVMIAFEEGRIRYSAVSMHFVTEEDYDAGPLFFSYPVHIQQGCNAEILGKEANKIEHAWQSYITNLVLEGKIKWDGNNPDSLVVPDYVPRIPILTSI